MNYFTYIKGMNAKKVRNKYAVNLWFNARTTNGLVSGTS